MDDTNDPRRGSASGDDGGNTEPPAAESLQLVTTTAAWVKPLQKALADTVSQILRATLGYQLVHSSNLRLIESTDVIERHAESVRSTTREIEETAKAKQRELENTTKELENKRKELENTLYELEESRKVREQQAEAESSLKRELDDIQSKIHGAEQVVGEKKHEIALLQVERQSLENTILMVKCNFVSLTKRQHSEVDERGGAKQRAAKTPKNWQPLPPDSYRSVLTNIWHSRPPAARPDTTNHGNTTNTTTTDSDETRKDDLFSELLMGFDGCWSPQTVGESHDGEIEPGGEGGVNPEQQQSPTMEEEEPHEGVGTLDLMLGPLPGQQQSPTVQEGESHEGGPNSQYLAAPPPFDRHSSGAVG